MATTTFSESGEDQLASREQLQTLREGSSSSSSTPTPSEPRTDDVGTSTAADVDTSVAKVAATEALKMTTPDHEAVSPSTMSRGSEQPDSTLPPLLKEDCPICLEEMTPVDHEHPLQCKSIHCEFNCCYHCIENLIISSKDDFMESSDGNFHVKVYLHCPNCRGDLSDSIRDTLLLRKTDAVILATELYPQELTEKQLQWQYAMTTNVDVMDAIQEARRVEKDFFVSHNRIVPSSGISSSLSIASTFSGSDTETDTDDEADVKDVAFGRQKNKASSPKDVLDLWGVEVDLINDVHESFYIPASHIPSPVHRFNMVDDSATSNRLRHTENQIDSTLMRGLEYFLDKEDQVEICNMLTSGDVDQLVDAAKWLYDAGESAHHPQQSQQQQRQDGGRRKKRPKPRLSRRSSVYMLIEESKQAHETAHAKRHGATQVLKSMRHHQRAQRRQQRRRMTVYDAKKRASFLKNFPLPVRMPKHVEQLPLDPFPINLIEGTWDGTVMDAFNCVHIRNGNGIMSGADVGRLLSSCGKGVATCGGAGGRMCGAEDNLTTGTSDPLASFTTWLDMLCQGDMMATSMHQGDDDITASQRQRQKQQEEYSMITQIPTTHKGVINNILGGIEVRIAMPGEHKRVYVQSITNKAGRLGIVKGDVITHLNGEPITCRETMEMRLLEYRNRGYSTIPITFNAEISVAEALKRRSEAILNDQY